jgi:hypothetical protein
VVGGTVWVVYGSQAPFMFGALIVVAALALTQFMRPALAPVAQPIAG